MLTKRKLITLLSGILFVLFPMHFSLSLDFQFLNHQIEDSLSLDSKIEYFTSELLDNYIEITWETSSDKGIESFELQKSTNGEEYITIKKEGTLRSLEGGLYIFIDTEIIHDKDVFYRIKLNGTKDITQYSEVSTIRVEKDIADYKFYYSTQNAQFIMEAKANFKGKGELSIFNAEKEEIWLEELKFHKGINKYEIGQVDIKPGIYFFHFRTRRGTYVQKALKPDVN